MELIIITEEFIVRCESVLTSNNHMQAKQLLLEVVGVY